MPVDPTVDKTATPYDQVRLMTGEMFFKKLAMLLKDNRDGSLDVYIQANSPGPDKEPNWLPLPPRGMVNLTIRIYNPKKEALDAAYKFPPVTRVD